MQISVFYVAIFAGMCLSLLVEIKFGVSPGGIVVPGYIALILDRPTLILNILLCSLVAFVIVKYVLSRWILVYGKRRFVACIMVALLLKALLSLFYPVFPFSILSFSGIGVVASGLLSNTYFKQGIVITVASCAAVSIVVFALIWLCSII